MVRGVSVLGLLMQAFHHRCGARNGALTSSFPLSSVSEPSPNADEEEGKVVAVSSAHELTAAIGRLWGLLHDELGVELGPAMVAGAVLTVALGADMVRGQVS